jgi:PHP family Zn ribbon phosphoesterase
MKKTQGQIIAQEVWNMLTDNAKVEMKILKKPFMESIAADVDAIVNKNFDLANVVGRSEQLFCFECNGLMKWDDLNEQTECEDCGCDLAK